MSAAAPAGPSKGVAMTIIGWITILWGGAHAVLGGCLIVGGDAIDKNLRPDDPAGGLAPALWPALWILAGLMIVIGVVVLLVGLAGALAGLGILWRQQWGRVLAFIIAVLSVMVGGLVSLIAYKQDAAGIATFGATEILYGMLAFVVLIQNGAAFSRRRF